MPDDLTTMTGVSALATIRREVETLRAERNEARAERDALKAALAEQTQRTLNAAADKLYALPADGAALKGPYWFRKGFTDAADLLRDWADYPAALDHPTEETPDA